MKVGICKQPSHVSIAPSLYTPQSTYRADADLLTDRLSIVDVYLVEVGLGELALESLKDRADDLARSTPLGPKVEDDDFVLADLEIARKPPRVSLATKRIRKQRLTSVLNSSREVTDLTILR